MWLREGGALLPIMGQPPLPDKHVFRLWEETGATLLTTAPPFCVCLMYNDIVDKKSNNYFQAENLQMGLYSPLLSVEAGFNSLRFYKVLKNLDEKH